MTMTITIKNEEAQGYATLIKQAGNPDAYLNEGEEISITMHRGVSLHVFEVDAEDVPVVETQIGATADTQPPEGEVFTQSSTEVTAVDDEAVADALAEDRIEEEIEEDDAPEEADDRTDVEKAVEHQAAGGSIHDTL